MDILLYLSIPLSSGFIGWITNVMAVKMTFYPLDYIGVRPFGWQGIIPSKSVKMANKAVDLLIGKLLKIEEHFAKIDPEIIAKEMNPSLLRLTKSTVDEVMQAQAPSVWENMPDTVKQFIYDKAGENTSDIVREVMQDIEDNVLDMLDFRLLTLDAVAKDKTLLNYIFHKCGEREFKFIERSGFYFGALFGLTQMVVVFFYTPWWLLPLFGVAVGYLTNWLALKLIFEPKKPIKIGRYEILGLFLKRQKEVSREYSVIISERVLTTEALMFFLSRSSGQQILSNILKKHLDKLIDDTYAKVQGAVEIWVDTEEAQKKLDIVKNIVHFKFMQEFHVCLTDVYPYIDETLNVQGVLEEKMANLPYPDFEGFLRPAFQEDEFILILVGAVLGGVAGVLQYFVLFG